ncbi:MAG: RpiB/LacA/LacB family sugar-phosphate isomerase [Candidatus Zambryskibacteria bacterium]|nr:RpiB/LacA/LacB family sugar-phosphate isomerase [Candidatus Zambryskibacteria bacterium]
MKIYVGADHAGFGLKEKLVPYLQELGYEVDDKGAFEFKEDDDYPDYIIPVAREVSQRPNEVRGIVLGGSGQGEGMAANKFRDVRATVFYGERNCIVMEEHESIIKISRADNNANLLSIGARFVTEEEMRNAVKEWLDTPFKNIEKYQRRIQKMERIHA